MDLFAMCTSFVTMRNIHDYTDLNRRDINTIRTVCSLLHSNHISQIEEIFHRRSQAKNTFEEYVVCLGTVL